MLFGAAPGTSNGLELAMLSLQRLILRRAASNGPMN
jgi:hypothetical protein